jgi:hypothetical protein
MTSDDREGFKARRTTGLAKRHEQRLNTCHYRGCFQRSVDPGAPILLCQHHLAQAIALVWKAP